MKRLIFLTAIILVTANPSFATGEKEVLVKPDPNTYLYNGELLSGEKALTRYLRKYPGDDQAALELGVVSFLRAVERLSQTLYKYGPLIRSQYVPFISLPVPENPRPETVTYEKLRSMIDTFGKDMLGVIKTLGSIKGNAPIMPLQIGRIKYDINLDKKYSDWETFWVLYSQLNRGANITAKDAERFTVRIDKADVHWLSGYCHLLAGISDFLLSFDFKLLFEAVAPYAFSKPDVKKGDSLPDEGLSDILDLRVIERERKKKALEHFLSCLLESRKCFDEAALETDDDNEWIPDPSQKGVIPGARVTAEMVLFWRKFLDEAEAILLGKKLVPAYYFSGDDSENKGLNLRSMILDEKKRNFFMIFASRKLPWIERGTLTDERFWIQLSRVFAGEFIGFAIWFN